MYPLLILPSRLIPGFPVAGKPDLIPGKFPVTDAGPALLETYATDAHFQTCHIPGLLEIPRLKKPALQALRAEGHDIVCQLWVADVDFQDHGSSGESQWTPTLQRSWKDRIGALSGPLMPWRAYTTFGGYRLLWRLERPLPVDVSEQAIRLFFAEGSFGDWGPFSPADPLFDWTRLFRLPRVSRPGKEHDPLILTLGTAPLDTSPWSSGVVLDPAVHAASLKRCSSVPEPASGLLKNPDGTYTIARRVLRKELQRLDVPYFEALFEDEPLAEEGNRHNAIKHTTASMVSLLHSKSFSRKGRRVEVTLELLWALLEPALERLGADNGSENFLDTGWELLHRAWSLQSEQARKSKQLRARMFRTTSDPTPREDEGAEIYLGIDSTADPALFALAKSLQEVIVASDPEAFAHLEPDQHWILAQTRLILIRGSAFYVMQQDGSYPKVPVTLKGGIRVTASRNGLDQIIRFIVPAPTRTDPDKMKALTLESLLYRYGTTIDDIYGVVRVCKSYYDPSRNVLVISFYKYAEIAPKRDIEVQEFLSALVGPENLEHFLDFLASLVHLGDVPCQMLALIGPSKTGKSLFVQGLARCYDGGHTVRDSKFDVSGFNAGIRKTPLIWIDENWADDSKATHLFRQIVGNAEVVINRKYEPQVDLKGYLKLVMTANSYDPLVKLFEDPSADSQEAVSDRLVVYRTHTEARDLLAGKDTHEWPTRIAGFLLWNHVQRIQGLLPPRDRFPVSSRVPKHLKKLILKSTDSFSAIMLEIFDHVAKDASIGRTVFAATPSPRGCIWLDRERSALRIRIGRCYKHIVKGEVASLSFTRFERALSKRGEVTGPYCYLPGPLVADLAEHLGYESLFPRK